MLPHQVSIVSVHLVLHRLAKTTAVSLRMTVRRGGGGACDRQEASLVVVAPKTALQAAGEREEGESLERTRRKARQEESRKRGTFSSGSHSMNVDVSELASPSSTSHQLVRAELFS